MAAFPCGQYSTSLASRVRSSFRYVLVITVLLGSAIAYSFSGCATKSLPTKAPTPSQGGIPQAQTEKTVSSTPYVASARSQITIATFNIKVFGQSKAGKPDVMQTLANIIRKYDIVAVQEIKDISGKAPLALLKLLPGYGLSLSPRTGLQFDDKKSQEQYAFFYKTNALALVGSAILYEDSQNDYFQREPHLARFRAGKDGFTFVLINIHTRPESAVQEICALDPVVTWAKAKFPEENDFITLGDFNAGCTYASPAQLNPCAIRGTNYFWIVPDTADSNLAKEQCAYDRIVLTAGTASSYTGQWGVEQAFTDKDISDHLPVWASFWSEKK